jgi:hypothetical protein
VAKIVKTDIQIMALKTLVGNLHLLEGINPLVDCDAENYQLVLCAGKKKAAVPLKKEEFQSMVEKLQRKLVNETEELAKKHAIALDEHERDILENRKGTVQTYEENQMV